MRIVQKFMENRVKRHAILLARRDPQTVDKYMHDEKHMQWFFF